MFVKSLDKEDERLLNQRRKVVRDYHREEGVLMDYQKTADLYREALRNIKL